MKSTTIITTTTKRKATRPRLKTFPVINDHDPNDRFEVRAANAHDAAYEALAKLGWWIAKR